MRFISLVMLFIAAMLISVSQTVAPLAAQTLTVKLDSQPQASHADGEPSVTLTLPAGAFCTRNWQCDVYCVMPDACRGHHACEGVCA